ncbi:MAG: M12 family metallopeptidase [Brevundimonas sp.]|uniref:M12 family metallopeptidase n=1 Tax=Brevundimonas sp. TaxID=1871086 RepID=UPI002488B40E|nr:M12 family metallopeptidase [Brevundimonas sp.]MDI1326245.1 M12 family metallopeptidase [Brevundimonas sp.]
MLKTRLLTGLLTWLALAPPAFAQNEPGIGPRPPFLEREPASSIDPDAPPSVFKATIDAANAEGGFGWVPKDLRWGPGADIRVCFLSNDRDLNRFVVSHASSWNDIGANVRFNFGSPSSPRRCQPGIDADVRVVFNTGQGDWSRYGKDARLGNPQWNTGSLHLDMNTITSSGARGTIIHEFGHALGMYHEHQKPIVDGCEDQFNWPVVYESLLRWNGWSAERVDSQLRPVNDFGASLVMSENIDRTSVMLYALPANLYRSSTSRCYIQWPNNEISEMDTAVVRAAYSAETYESQGYGFNAAIARAVENGDEAVARGIALYALPQSTLAEIAATYDEQLSFGFNPTGSEGAEAQLESAINAVISRASQPE